MEALLIWAGFGAAAAITAVVSVRRVAPFYAALVLLTAWVADTVMGLTGVHPSTHQVVNLGLDILFALGFAAAWWAVHGDKTQRNWLMAIAVTYAVQVWAHAAQGEAPVSHAYGATMNGVCALQFLILNLSERPRIGQAIGSAWNAVWGGNGPDCRRNRPRGVVATVDAFLCKTGGWFLDRPVRQKSR